MHRLFGISTYIFARYALILGHLGLTGLSPAMADPMADVCDRRARSESGYRAPLALQTPDGRGQVRLSGSVALGGSSSRGVSSPPAPAFAGAVASERREQERQQKQVEKYRRIYERCLQGR